MNKYLTCLRTEHIHCTQEVKFRTVLAMKALNRKKTLLYGPLDTKLGEKKVVRRFVWIVYIKEIRREKFAGLQDVNMEKDGKDFQE